MRIRVKICGITRLEDAMAAVQHGADAIGFILWPQSERYISSEEAGRIVKCLPPFVRAVGVYVNPDKSWVEETSALPGLISCSFMGMNLPISAAGFICRISKLFVSGTGWICYNTRNITREPEDYCWMLIQQEYQGGLAMCSIGNSFPQSCRCHGYCPADFIPAILPMPSDRHICQQSMFRVVSRSPKVSRM